MAALLRRSPTFLRRFSALAAPSPPPSTAASDRSVGRLKSAIWSESDPDRLADLFESASHVASIRTDRPLYKEVIQKLSRARRNDLVERVLQGQLVDPTAPKSEGFVIRLIGLYSVAGMPDKAASMFSAMPSMGCPRTERALCALLSAYLDNRCIDDLRNAFETVPKEIGKEPGVVAYNIFLQGLAYDGDMETARKMFDEMPSKGVEQDIVTCNAMLDGYMRKGDDAGFEGIVKEIVVKRLKPNVSTYNYRIAALCKKGKSFEAEELLDVMDKKNVLANRGSFNAVIDGYCKEGNGAAAKKIFERMRVAKRADGKQGVSPNFETYIILLRGLVEKGEFTPALEVCKECLFKKWAPPFDSVKALIEGLKKHSQVKDATDLVSKMKAVVKGDAADAWKKVEDGLGL